MISVLQGVTALTLILNALNVSFFTLHCRNSTQVLIVDKAFEVAIGYNVTNESLGDIKVYEHNPMCNPISYFALPIIMIEFIKTIFIITKFYSQVKTKYLSEQKKKNIANFVKQPKKVVKILLKRANSLPNFEYNMVMLNTIKQRKSSIQTNINFNHTKIHIPTRWLLFKTLKFYLFRSNFFIFITITLTAFSIWSSIGTKILVLKVEVVFAYYVPIFLFLTESTLRNILKNQLSKVVPLNQ